MYMQVFKYIQHCGEKNHKAAYTEYALHCIFYRKYNVFRNRGIRFRIFRFINIRGRFTKNNSRQKCGGKLRCPQNNSDGHIATEHGCHSTCNKHRTGIVAKTEQSVAIFNGKLSFFYHFGSYLCTYGIAGYNS